MSKRKLNPEFIANQWKPGQVTNPLGAGAHNPEMKRLKALTRKELVDIGNLVIMGDMEQLERISKDPKETVLRRMLASVSRKVIDKGDMQALDILLNRMVGKVKDEFEIKGMDGGPLAINFLKNKEALPIEPEKLPEPESGSSSESS